MNTHYNIHRQMPGLYVLKTKDSEFVEFNDALLAYTGFSTRDALLGLTDCECPWNEYVTIYRQHEIDALNGKIYNTIQPACDSTGRQFFWFNTKYPQINEQGETVGIVCHAVEIINPEMVRLADHVVNHSITHRVEDHYVGREGPIHLTARQEECLYLLLHGKTSQGIADRLFIDVRTVEGHIDKLKEKFEVKNRVQLAVKAIDLGYRNNIPIRLYRRGLLGMIED